MIFFNFNVIICKMTLQIKLYIFGIKANAFQEKMSSFIDKFANNKNILVNF